MRRALNLFGPICLIGALVCVSLVWVSAWVSHGAITLTDIPNEAAFPHFKDIYSNNNRRIENALLSTTNMQLTSGWMIVGDSDNQAKAKEITGDFTITRGTGDISGAAITSDEIALGAVKGSNIGGGTITSPNIGLGEVKGSNIGGGTITSPNIGLGEIKGSNIGGGTITSPLIGLGEVKGSNIGGGTITSPNIGLGGVAGSNMAGGTITSDKIGLGEIKGSNVAEATITSSKIPLGEIKGSNVAGGTITSDKIGLGEIKGSNVGGGTITSPNIALGGVAGSNLTTEANLRSTVIAVPAFGTTTTSAMWRAPQACTIRSAALLGDKSTAGSYSTTNWWFELTNTTAAKGIGFIYTTNGAELTASTPFAFNLNGTTNMTASDVLRLSITSNGLPTDMSGANLKLILDWN